MVSGILLKRHKEDRHKSKKDPPLSEGQVVNRLTPRSIKLIQKSFANLMTVSSVRKDSEIASWVSAALIIVMHQPHKGIQGGQPA
jgi:hypothetical protein